MTPMKRNATYDDLCAVPDLLIAEIIDGDLYASARPPIRYGYAASTLAFELGWAFRIDGDEPGDWLFLNKPEIHLREDAIVPDTAAWRRDRLSKKMPDYLTLAPDWLCEVFRAEHRSA